MMREGGMVAAKAVGRIFNAKAQRGMEEFSGEVGSFAPSRVRVLASLR